MIFNVVGTNFRDDLSSCFGKKARSVVWDHRCSSNAPTVHLDSNMLVDPLPGHGPHYGWLLETPATTERFKALLSSVEERFEWIFTHSTALTARGGKYAWAPASGIWIKDMQIHSKTKLCSMITSPKTMLPGHRARVRWARAYQNQIDVFGLDSRIATKEEGLCDYMFSVAMENAVAPGYFTEKILDCFATGTVPIYHGAPDIADFFNPAGIIVLSNTFGLEDLSLERYESMLPAIRENFERALQYEIPEDYIVKHYFNTTTLQPKKERPAMNLGDAIKAGDLEAAEAAVKEIRKRPDVNAVERGLAALTLALAYYDKDMLTEAETWALRSLQGNFRSDSLKLLGEIAWGRMDFESAIGWYEAAAGITHEPPIPLVGSDSGRLEEMRRESMEAVRPVRFGPPDDQTHALVVQSVPDRWALRQTTLESLDAAGALRWRGPKILVIDGPPPVGSPGNWQVRAMGGREGQARTYFRALREAIDSGAKRLTFFEDDVVLAKNALDYIARALFPEDAPIIAWWNRMPAPFRQGPPMYLLTEGCAFVRNVALSMSCETAKKLLESDIVKNWAERHAGDMIYTEALPGAKAALHFPGLVQHMGDDSLVGKTEIRKSSTFIGANTDALTLI